MEYPLVSIIIVNFNGEKWLESCLNSLNSMTYKNFEIIIVDNDSNDSSIEIIKRYENIKLIKNNENSGFAKGNNIGLKYSSGDYILLLNNDTIVEKDFLSKLVHKMTNNSKIGSVQPKIYQMTNHKKIESCGSYLTNNCFLYHYGFNKRENVKKYNISFKVFSNLGSCMLIKKSVIDKIGLFDEDFLCYYEEVDFCHRVWISGYECWYEPNSSIYHYGGGTSMNFNNSIVLYNHYKNKYSSMIKNYEIKNMYRIIYLLFANIFISLIFLLKGNLKHFIAIYRSIFWNIKNINNTIKKRKKVQNIRKLTDKAYFKSVKKNPRLKYYYYYFTNIGDYKD